MTATKGDQADFETRVKQFHPTSYCAKKKGSCRAYAESARRLIFINEYAWNHRQGPLIYHEYGHLVGLVDTYIEEGRFEGFPEQMPSLMNQQADYISDDDRDSLKHLWAYLQQGVSPNKYIAPGCPSNFYLYVDTKDPKDPLFYCTPKPVGDNQ